jgi:hypothetical protein
VEDWAVSHDFKAVIFALSARILHHRALILTSTDSDLTHAYASAIPARAVSWCRIIIIQVCAEPSLTHYVLLLYE